MTTQQIVLQGPGPWGFRLVGGKDFEQPLAISRPSLNSSSTETVASLNLDPARKPGTELNLAAPSKSLQAYE